MSEQKKYLFEFTAEARRAQRKEAPPSDFSLRPLRLCGALLRFIIMLGVLTGHVLAQQPSAKEETAEVRSTSPPASTTSAAAAPTTGAHVQLESVQWGGFQVKNTMEFGPRWRDVDGNEDVYRSHVNLGNGLKLFHSSFELIAPESSGPLFDRLAVNLDNWGGDPYNTVDVNVKKNLWYDFQYRYQKIDYFNFIPEFANPLLDQGVAFDQHSYDTTRRMSNARLELFPQARRFQAHVSYARNSAFGPAFTTVNLGGDEFLINRLVKNSVNDYRFGFDLRLWKLEFSFEQGFRKFKDDQGNALPGGFSLGNDPTPIFDFQQLFLTEFLRGYFVRGTIPTTRVAVSSYGIRRVAFTARLYYSDADIDYDFSQLFNGIVVNRETSIFASSGFFTNQAAPSKPYTVADGTIRIRVMPRVAVTNTFRGAHFVIAGSRVLNEQLTDNDNPDQPVAREETSFRRTFLNSFTNQFEGDVAVTRNLIVRAGHRFEHRRVVLQQRDLAFDSIGGPEFPTLDRMRDEETEQDTNTLLVGLSYRWQRFFRLALDYENGGYLTEFTRVDPRDFQRGRLRLQFRPSDKWLFTVSGFVYDQTRPNHTLDGPDRVLQNQNRSRRGGFSVSWFPTERVTLDLDYTRGHVTARIHTIDLLAGGAPLPLVLYKEDSNVLHSGVDLNLYKGVLVGFGYRLVNSSGSFPINFHRPYARLSIPLHRVLSLNLGYQHYGYNERGRSVQDYRANLLTTSLKLSF